MQRLDDIVKGIGVEAHQANGIDTAADLDREALLSRIVNEGERFECYAGEKFYEVPFSRNRCIRDRVLSVAQREIVGVVPIAARKRIVALIALQRVVPFAAV